MYKGKTQSQWTSEIDGYNWENSYLPVMKRLYPHSEIEVLNPQGKTGANLYDELMPYRIISGHKEYDNKFPYGPMIAQEVENYKTEKQSEVDRAFRIYDLTFWGEAKEKAGVFSGYTNFDLFFKELMEDDTHLSAIEAEHDLIKEEHEFEAGVQEKEKRIKLGQRCVATINFMNEKNEISESQVAVILSDSGVQQIMNALNTGSLKTAKNLIAAIDLTNLAPMNQSYKDRLIGMIDAYLGE